MAVGRADPRSVARARHRATSSTRWPPTVTPAILVVPHGFTSDHLEVLYDLDIEAADRARGRRRGVRPDRGRQRRPDGHGRSRRPGPPDMPMAERTRRVAVVGGGIAGLAAAWEASGHDGVEVEVHEAGRRGSAGGSPRPRSSCRRATGGRRRRRRVPGSRPRRRRPVPGARHRDTSSSAPRPGGPRSSSEGVLRDLPTNSVLGVPLDFDDLAATGILSAAGLARVEERRPGPRCAPPPPTSRSARSWPSDSDVEVVDHLVGPLIGGINAGDVDRLSMPPSPPSSPRPQRTAAASSRPSAADAPTAPPMGPVFLAPVGGMGRLVDAVVDGCRARGVRADRPAPSVDTIESIDADVVVRDDPGADQRRLLEPVSPAPRRRSWTRSPTPRSC